MLFAKECLEREKGRKGEKEKRRKGEKEKGRKGEKENGRNAGRREMQITPSKEHSSGLGRLPSPHSSGGA